MSHGPIQPASPRRSQRTRRSSWTREGRLASARRDAVGSVPRRLPRPSAAALIGAMLAWPAANALAQVTWDGDTNNLFTEATNWTGDTLPAANLSTTFNANTTPATIIVDADSNTGTMNVLDSFVLSIDDGATLNLNPQGTVGINVTGGNSLSIIPTALTGTVTVADTNVSLAAAAGNSLSIGTDIVTGGNTLTLSGGGSVTVTGDITGAGNVIVNDGGNGGIFTLGPGNSAADATGAFTLTSGTLNFTSNDLDAYDNFTDVTIEGGTINSAFSGTLNLDFAADADGIDVQGDIDFTGSAGTTFESDINLTGATTFNAGNTNGVAINGNIAGNDLTLNGSQPFAFNGTFGGGAENLTIEMDANTDFVAINADVTSAGTLTLVAGDLTLDDSGDAINGFAEVVIEGGRISNDTGSNITIDTADTTWDISGNSFFEGDNAIQIDANLEAAGNVQISSTAVGGLTINGDITNPGSLPGTNFTVVGTTNFTVTGTLGDAANDEDFTVNMNNATTKYIVQSAAASNGTFTLTRGDLTLEGDGLLDSFDSFVVNPANNAQAVISNDTANAIGIDVGGDDFRINNGLTTEGTAAINFADDLTFQNNTQITANTDTGFNGAIVATNDGEVFTLAGTADVTLGGAFGDNTDDIEEDLTINMGDDDAKVNLGAASESAGELILSRGDLTLTNANSSFDSFSAFRVTSATPDEATLSNDSGAAITVDLADPDPGDDGVNETFALTGGLTLAGADGFTFNDIISGSGELVVAMDNANAQVVLAAENTATGALTLEQGDLAFNDAALGDDGIANFTDITLNGGVISNDTGASLTINTADNTIDVSGGFTTEGADSIRFSDALNMLDDTVITANAQGGTTTFAGQISSTDGDRLLTLTGSEDINLNGAFAGTNNDLTINMTTGDAAVAINTAPTVSDDDTTDDVQPDFSLLQGTLDMNVTGGDTLSGITEFAPLALNFRRVNFGSGGGSVTVNNNIGTRALFFQANQASDDDGDPIFDYSLNGDVTFAGEFGTSLSGFDPTFGDTGFGGAQNILLTNNPTVTSAATGDSDNEFEIFGDVYADGQTLSFTGPTGVKFRANFHAASEFVDAPAGTNALVINMNGDSVLVTVGGQNTFTGPTTIQRGLVQFERLNDFAGTPFFTGPVVLAPAMGQSATLAGNGQLRGGLTVGSNTAGATAQVRPGGNGVGTLNVSGGNFRLNSDGVYVAQVSAAGTNDRISVGNGRATLANGSIVRVVQVAGDNDSIQNQQKWTILSTGNGIADQGAIFEGFSGFEFDATIVNRALVITALIDADLFTDTLPNGTDPALAGAMGSLVQLDNPQAVELLDELKTLAENNPAGFRRYVDETYDAGRGAAIVPAATNTQAVAGFNNAQSGYMAARRDGLPGTALASGTSNRSAHGTQLASFADDPALLAHVLSAVGQGQDAAPAAEHDNPYGAYVKVFGLFVNEDEQAGRVGYDGDGFGVQFGVDREMMVGGNDLLVGLGFGYTRSQIEYSSLSGDIDTDSFRFGPYASYEIGQGYVSGSLTGGVHKSDAHRSTLIDPNVTADYNAVDFTAYVEGGYDFDFDRMTLTPWGAFQYTFYSQEDYSEKGVGGLSYDEYEDSSFITRLGATIAYELRERGFTLVPEASLAWQHEFLDDQDDVQARYAAGGSSFNIQTADADGDAVVFGAGLTALLDGGASIFFEYEGAVSDATDSHLLTLGGTFNF